ncbi:MAG: iron-containing redox enzyme family protein [Planctomycetes bacterium]|nr:iron-containing redox enzyme family protein [Planctomycetota bacterium]
MGTVAEKFFDQLRKEIHSHPAMTHSFLKRFAEGDLKKEGPRIFAEQYYQYSKHFSRYLAFVIGTIPDEPAREPLIKNLFEEYGGREEEQRGMDLDLVHANIFRSFCKATGADPDHLDDVALLPETSLFVERYFNLPNLDFVTGLGALGPGTEYIVPYIYEPISKGLTKMGYKKEDILFFDAHIELDVEHAENIWHSISPYANKEENHEKLRHGTLYMLESRQVFWSGLERECCP